MLLVAAKILAGYRERLQGNIKFVFQPNEESVGAKAMIDEGVLESPRVDCCLGQHLWCPLPTGELGLSSGPIMAGMDHFTLRIKGKGGHTAAPHMAVDPILCASEIIQSLQAVQTRETDPLTPVVIMFGQINGGTASNVIPDQVEVSGTLRHLCPESAERESSPQGRMERLISHICQAHRAGYGLDFLYGHPALVNDAGTVDLVREATRSCGFDQGAVQPLVTLAGEDFSEFAARVPSAFYFVGAGNEEKGTCYPHHHPCFNIDEDALSIGVELHVRSALEYFRRHG
jgi:amidohydrolase